MNRLLLSVYFISVSLLFPWTRSLEIVGTTNDVNRQIAASGSPTQILSCRTKLDKSVAFYFKPWMSSEEADEIYDRYDLLNGYKSKYVVERNEAGFYILRTSNASAYHAGKYFCIENDGIGGQLSTGDLTVIDSGLNCSSNRTDSGSVVLRCEIKFFGVAVDLSILWSRRGSFTLDEYLVGSTLTKLDNGVLAEIEVDINSSPWSGANLRYVIDVGKNCQNAQQFCSILRRPITIPYVATTRTTSDWTDRFEPTTSTDINLSNRDWIGIAVGVPIAVLVIVVILVVFCICRRKYKHNDKLPKQTEQRNSGQDLQLLKIDQSNNNDHQ